MNKTAHPAETRNQSWIDTAVRFDVSVFLGFGKFHIVPAATLAEAQGIASQIAARRSRALAQPIIYAHTAEGRTGVTTNY
jgi:hypothetical protein